MLSTMSTPRLTIFELLPLNSLFMGEVEKEPSVPSLPLKDWLGRRPRGARTQLAAQLGIDLGRLSNWLRRGIPEGQVRFVAAAMGTDYYGYLAMAGIIETKPKQIDIDDVSIMKDIAALPPGLKAHLARKASELGELYKGLPDWIKKAMENPPVDPAAYKQWELDIEAMIARYQGPTPPAPI